MDSIGEELEALAHRPDVTGMDVLIKDDDDDSASSEATLHHLEEAVPQTAKTIKTKGRFNFMDLPTELQLKIHEFALISPETITINPEATYSNATETSKAPNASSKLPTVALLRTCRKVCNEANPIFYGMNNFAIYLSPDRNTPFPLSKFRWPTILNIKSLTFSCIPDPATINNTYGYKQATFQCQGIDLLVRFKKSDFRYSPVGPDYFMGLSMSNWVSARVMQATMKAFQMELEALINRDPI